MDANLLSNIYITHIFFQSMTYPFTLLLVPFKGCKFLILMKSNFLAFSFVVSPFYVLIFKNCCLCHGHEDAPLCFLLEYLLIYFTLKAIVHPELIFQCEAGGSRLIFSYRYIIVPIQLMIKTILSSLNCDSVMNQVTIYVCPFMEITLENNI